MPVQIAKIPQKKGSASDQATSEPAPTPPPEPKEKKQESVFSGKGNATYASVSKK